MYQELLRKEWIKTRLAAWFIPVLLLYASADSFLVLRTIKRVHGSFGLVATLVSKQPLFFDAFLVLPVIAVLLAFLQVWPEAQGRRLRLLFHTPMAPERIIAVTLVYGGAVLLLTNLAAHLLLIGCMRSYHLTSDIISPVSQTLLIWSLLSFAFYFTTAALLYNSGIRLLSRSFALLCAWVAWDFMGGLKGYSAHIPGIPALLLFVVALIPLVYYSCLGFRSSQLDSRSFRLSRGLSLLLVTLCLCSFLPELYWRSVMPAQIYQRLSYSHVAEQFIVFRHNAGDVAGPKGASLGTLRMEDGRRIDRQQRSYLLPTLYADDMLKWKAFPLTINGQILTLAKARHLNYAHLAPADWNSANPLLYMLFESRPTGAKLETPDDFFRLAAAGSGLEFIDPRSGSVKAEKSALYNQALVDAGFAFPIVALAGNAELRKVYDEGFLLIDRNNHLFQLKQVDGLPWCRSSRSVVEGSGARLIVAENRRREMLGWLITDTALFTIAIDDLNLHRVPLADFSANRTAFTWFNDLLGKYIVTEDIKDYGAGLSGHAFDSAFSLKRELLLPREEVNIKALESRRKVASFLFPFHLTPRDLSTSFRQLHLNGPDFWGYAVIGNLFMVIAVMLFKRTRRGRIGRSDVLLVLLFGCPALVVIMLEQVRLSQVLVKKLFVS